MKVTLADAEAQAAQILANAREEAERLYAEATESGFAIGTETARLESRRARLTGRIRRAS